MNTSIRARHTARGFSFVELLVTIVIAGIIFAAMVPVFVGATQKNLSDTLRLQAANVAQDKIEKIRQMPYGSIAADKNATPLDNSSSLAAPNLYNKYFADGQFGSHTDLSTGSGTRRMYTDYGVTLYPAASTGLASQYKVVTVTAYWDAPPAPVKKVVLQTIVYRQYAGPPITSFSTDPIISDNGVMGGRDLTLATLSAHVDMSSGVTLASLQFKVSAFGGQTIASQLVATVDTDPTKGFWYDGNGTFYWKWDCSIAANTVYDLQATAFSADDFAGNTPHQYPSIDHILPVAPPGALFAGPGNGAARLSWGLSPDSDLASYEVFRAASPPAGPWTTLVATVTKPATTYIDNTPPLVNGDTYYYAVRAVTNAGRRSALVVSKAVIPVSSPDTTPPTAPSPVTATAATTAGTITLGWGASTDLAVPSTGVLMYEIWRSANGTDWGASPLKAWINLLDLSYPDASAGWNKQWYYEIRALDGALNAGDWSEIVSATTVSQQWHDLKIALATKKSVACTVWVLGASDHHYYDAAGNDKGTSPPAGTPIVAAGSVTFSHLPDGPYTVFCDWASGGSDTYGVAVQTPFGTLSNLAP